MNNKNTRVKLLKEETVNEVTLNDLLDLAGKSEIAVMQLADNCMKFNSNTLKQKAALVKKELSQLSDAIRAQIMGNDQETNATPVTPLESPGQIPAGTSRLESDNLGVETKPEMDALVENKKKKLKNIISQLKEAFGVEDDEQTEPATDETEDTEDTTTDSTPEETTDDSTSTIDLSGPFNNVISGLSDEQFATFKTDIVDALKASGITDGVYLALVQELEQTSNVDDFNFSLDKLYDYADDNGIEIVTEAPEVETPSEDAPEEVTEIQPAEVPTPITESKKKK